MELSLDEINEALLREILDSTSRDLKFEIADTDNGRFTASLRRREEQIVRLLDASGGARPEPNEQSTR